MSGLFVGACRSCSISLAALVVWCLAVLGETCVAFAAEPAISPGKPNIWGVWLGTGGYPDVDPRYRNTPWPKVEFTPWGAAESKRLTTPETPDECMPFGPIGYMSANSLFPIEIARSTTGLLVL